MSKEQVRNIIRLYKNSEYAISLSGNESIDEVKYFFENKGERVEYQLNQYRVQPRKRIGANKTFVYFIDTGSKLLMLSDNAITIGKDIICTLDIKYRIFKLKDTWYIAVYRTSCNNCKGRTYKLNYYLDFRLKNKEVYGYALQTQ